MVRTWWKCRARAISRPSARASPAASTGGRRAIPCGMASNSAGRWRGSSRPRSRRLRRGVARPSSAGGRRVAMACGSTSLRVMRDSVMACAPVWNADAVGAIPSPRRCTRDPKHPEHPMCGLASATAMNSENADRADKADKRCAFTALSALSALSLFIAVAERRREQRRRANPRAASPPGPPAMLAAPAPTWPPPPLRRGSVRSRARSRTGSPAAR